MWGPWKRSAPVARPYGPLTFEQVRTANLNRSESDEGFAQPIIAMPPSERFVELIGELGEAANALKKLNRIRLGVARGNKAGDSADDLRQRLAMELGDAVLSLDLLCQGLGFMMEDLAIKSFNAKSQEIGYPGRI